jgi:tRNA(Ile)-lysidine synthetase-like protein
VVIADGKYLNPKDEIDYSKISQHKVTAVGGQYIWLTSDEYLNEDLDELEDSQTHPYLIESGAVPAKIKVLQFDEDEIPKDAKVCFKRAGDKFTKYGGGTKSLGDYFTDKKIPPRLRGVIPVIVGGQSQILAVCGVEISDKIKVTEKTKRVGYLICADYLNL